METLVQEEDTQPITEPIVKPVKTTKWGRHEKDLPPTTYNKEYVVISGMCPLARCGSWRNVERGTAKL